ncbi:hypothetical protein GGX14DRAFT_408388 [Mycena pura]|uniref:Uncharacterized protein n=1 Tax=Mycena pura TaxID=153505 RepID=A0AAD6XW21_9AGAR|nr:hypothetical protein GGX14DRAFT_408388 [Mycena pura]
MFSLIKNEASHNTAGFTPALAWAKIPTKVQIPAKGQRDNTPAPPTQEWYVEDTLDYKKFGRPAVWSLATLSQDPQPMEDAIKAAMDQDPNAPQTLDDKIIIVISWLGFPKNAKTETPIFNRVAKEWVLKVTKQQELDTFTVTSNIEGTPAMLAVFYRVNNALEENPNFARLETELSGKDSLHVNVRARVALLVNEFPMELPTTVWAKARRTTTAKDLDNLLNKYLEEAKWDTGNKIFESLT